MQHFRVRRVITRGPTRVMGKFPSIKSGRAHHWESQLERDRMYALELDPRVIGFCEQPMKLQLYVYGKERTYTPDIAVETRNGTIVEEIKPADKVDKYLEIYEAASRQLADRGIDFRVVTNIEIRREPFLSNISNLLPFRYFEVDTTVLDYLEAAFHGHRKISFSVLKDRLFTAGFPAWIPWALIAQNFILLDLDQKITGESQIGLNRGALECLR